MPPRITTRLTCALFLAFFCTGATAQLKSLETERLRLIYIDPLQTFLTPHVARCFESSMKFQNSRFGYEPSEPITVILVDTSDFGGASAGSVPKNALLIDVAPLSFAFETMPPGERMSMIMNHELVHVVSMDQAAGSDVSSRKFFRGKVKLTADHPETILYSYLTTPRVPVPSWYQEGTAVFMETWMAGGLGRAQGAYDEMVFRAKVRDAGHFYDALGLVSEGTKIDFQAGINAYLYGTRFISYLAHEYTPQSVVQWISRTEGSKKYYAAQFKQVYGKSIAEAWDEWIAWERDFQQRNLEEIRRYPTTEYEDLSPRALGSVSRAYYDPETREVYAAFNYPGVVAHAGAISLDDGSVRKLVDVKDPAIYTVTSLTYDPETKTVFYTSDNTAERDLRAIDVRAKKSRLLLKDARIGDLAFNPADRSIWGVRQYNGISTLVRIPEPYDEWNQVHSFPYGEVIYDVDLSPDGRLLSASFAEINGRHAVRVMEIEKVLEHDLAPLATVDFESVVPSNFVFSPDGRYLYGSSYYTGVSNIFRYEVAADKLEAVSNSETGFFRPIPLADDSLLVFRYSGEGFVPARIAERPLEDLSAITFLGQQVIEKHPVLSEWVAESPAQVPLDSMVTYDGEYKSIRSVSLDSIYPVVEGYKDSIAYGFSTKFSDPIYVNQFSFSASYSPDNDLASDERLHMRFKYEHNSWNARFKLNGADFYDLFGPTKTSRKGYTVGGGYLKPLIHDTPRSLDFSADLTFHGDLEKLPRFQNVDATFDKLWNADVGLSYSNQRASIGAVDFEKGLKADATINASYVDGDMIPALIANFDIGVPLPMGNSSLWLRNSTGAAFGELNDPFANFFFGGFGNNWVDHRSIKRYRAFFAFPGVELNEIGGRNYVKSTIEWNLPPLRFRRVGSPGFYLTWARFALFAGGIQTNLDVSSAERKLANVGAQIDFRAKVLSKLDMTLSVGYARAFEKGLDARDEFMASLKILR